MKQDGLKYQRVTFTFPPKFVELLQAKSKETGLTMSDIMRRSFELWVKENAPKPQNQGLSN